MFKTTSLIIATLTLAATQAQAENGYTIEAGLSTLGLTITPGYRYNSDWGFRMPMGYMPYSTSFEEDGTTVQGDSRLGGVGALIDYYPMDNGFHFTGGIMAPLYQLKGQSNGATTTIDGVAYNVDDFDSKIYSKGVAPYLGIGYQYGSPEGGWGGSMELGAMFNVSYGSEYSYTNGNLSPSEQIIFENEVNQLVNDVLGTLNEDASILPFISFQVSYSF